MLKLISRIAEWTKRDGSRAGAAMQAVGAPDSDRLRQMGIQPPWRELSPCSLSWPGQPPKLQATLREEPWEQGPPQNVCPSKTASPTPQPGLGLGPWCLRCLLEIMDGKVLF